MRLGDLVVLGGDVGSGKSALALAVALRATAEGNGVVFLSGEMTAERIMERALAIEGRASVDALRGGRLDDVSRASVGAAALRLRAGLPLIGRIAGGGVQALDDVLRSVLDVELAVVDSVVALGVGAAPQDEELAGAVRHLKRLALETGLAILVTAPLAADVRARSDRRPTLSDFGVLGAIRQHADVVIALYREEQYSPGFGAEGGTELLVLKNRNGAISYADLYFNKRWLRFEDMLDPE
jgi:replicative DNA helicase